MPPAKKSKPRSSSREPIKVYVPKTEDRRDLEAAAAKAGLSLSAYLLVAGLERWRGVGKGTGRDG